MRRHHIAMKGVGPLKEQAQEILCRNDINPFTGCENLCYSQNHCHGNVYAEEVVRKLVEAERTGGSLLEALRDLAVWHRKCGEGTTVNPDTDE